MTTFVRVGPSGLAYGPFDSRSAALDWLSRRGFYDDQEGATFKVYEAHDPDLFTVHHAMREMAS